MGGNKKLFQSSKILWGTIRREADIFIYNNCKSVDYKKHLRIADLEFIPNYYT